MKTRILVLLSILFCGMTYAQEPASYFDQNFGEPVIGEDNVTIECVIFIDGVQITAENYDVYDWEIASFSVDENIHRGTGWVKFFHNNAYFGSMFAGGGENGEIQSFKLYNHTTGQTSDDMGLLCTTTIEFTANAIIGTTASPFEINFFTPTTYTFNNKEDNKWSTVENWTVNGTTGATALPNEGSACTIKGTCVLDVDNVVVNSVSLGLGLTSFTILNGKTLVTESLKSTTETRFFVEDGGQVRFSTVNGNAKITMKKNINGYEGSRDNYYFLSSPVIEGTYPYLPINKINNLLEGNYDLYYFAGADYDHEQQDIEWRNYKFENFSNFDQGKGYLYANDDDRVLSFQGQLIPSTLNTLSLAFESDPDYQEYFPYVNYHLIGNPLSCNAAVTGTNIAGYYMINEENSRKNVIVVKYPVVAPITGIMVVTCGSNPKVFFEPTESDANVRGAKSNGSFLNLEVNNANGNLVDRAYVEMNEGEGLKKFNLNNDATQIYFQQNGKDYAIVHAERATQLPVFFKTREYGQYTINVKLENLTCEYLHLIDNLTGMDVDLLATPSYTFQANSSDYAARFKIVFEGTGVEENTANESFAIVEGNRVIIPAIEHESTLEVIDMTGRTVISQKVNGSFDQTLNVKAGLYILNLNGMTQKIVIE